jgi:hypothetical protein
MIRVDTNLVRDPAPKKPHGKPPLYQRRPVKVRDEYSPPSGEALRCSVCQHMFVGPRCNQCGQVAR